MISGLRETWVAERTRPLLPFEPAPLLAPLGGPMATVGDERGKLVDGDGEPPNRKRRFDGHRPLHSFYIETAGLVARRAHQEFAGR
jgi:hypothetical protein